MADGNIAKGAEPASRVGVKYAATVDADIFSWDRSPLGGNAKRAFDVIGASAALLVFAPFWLLVAALIKLQDGGGVLYRHDRVGRCGRMFGCFKFRSMVRDADERLRQHLSVDLDAAAEWRRSNKLLNDPRITPLGQFLRATSLDEVPQLLNVIAGDMSLVGPRPVVEDELPRYGIERVHYFCARPGLTGLWQVTGRSDASYARRISLDKEYVQNWSLSRDVSICFRTLWVVLLRSGAY